MSLSRRSGAIGAGTRVVAAVALLLILGAGCLWMGSRGQQSSASNRINQSEKFPFPTSAPSMRPQVAGLGQLPLIFEQNQGQTDGRVSFLSHGPSYGLFLTSDAAVLRLDTPRGKNTHQAPGVLSMAIAGGNPHIMITGEDLLPGKTNYFIGNDPSKWHRGVPQFAKVRYANVYPGVDLIFYGSRGQLEYDFELAPGADPAHIALRFEGAKNTSIDAHGNLVLALAAGDVELQAPQTYQYVGHERRMVAGRFVLRAKNEVGFVVDDYDRSRKLVIDPILSYSTYLGGTRDESCLTILGLQFPVAGCPAVAVDTASNVYIAGITDSTNFPTVSARYPALKGTAADVFISKINNGGNTLLYSTYLGGTGTDYPVGIAVDQGFNILVAGNTTSSDFPTGGTNTAFQGAPLSTNTHVFFSELDSTGQTLVYSTYLSGNGADTASGLAVDSVGNGYVTGVTSSTESATGFPSTLGAYQPNNKTVGGKQFFLTKVSPSLKGAASIPYSTYFGGSTTTDVTNEAVGGGVAVDPSSNVYITGGTTFSPPDMPILNASQGSLKGGIDVFVAKINPAAVSGTQLLYATYFGGSGDDIAYGIAADGTSAYITGSTTSTDLPTAGTGVYQAGNGGGTDAFMAKITNPVTTGGTTSSATLAYVTYIGGMGTDVGYGIVVDKNQGARIAGWTNSTNIPALNNTIQIASGGGYDAFVARIDTTATTADAPGHYFTYLGGTGNDYGTSIAVDPQLASYVVGETASSNFPTQSALYGSLSGGTGTDAFVTKLGPVLSLTLDGAATPTTVGVGNQVSFIYTITNAGDAANEISFTDTLPVSGASFSSTPTISGGSCGSASGGIVGCFLGTLNAGATATATVFLTPTANTIPSTVPIQLGNTASVGVTGSTPVTATTNVTVNDFNIAVSPSTRTVPAGVPATYTATLTPTGPIPDSISISCSSGLPTGATCTETTNPFADLANGPQSTSLVINSTARVTTTTELRHSWPLFYGICLPLAGIALLGMRGNASRRNRMLSVLLVGAFVSLVMLQPACSSSKTTTTTSGTPAGTYVVTVAATSGSATRNATVTLVVQ